uniref:Conserved protein n=1 Tax=uncultured bacterium contig00107 TaxID=1181573 RepID=A0A806KPH7_9BACT|nr:conserved protein [uncultured bacterium contig00107]
MVHGDPKRIDLGTSSFTRLREGNCLYIDKTRFIENFLNESNMVQLVVRQRRLGKSLNLDTLRCFLTDKEDNRTLFKGTYVEGSHVWEMANSAPVFLFDFKSLNKNAFKEEIFEQVRGHIVSYVDVKTLADDLKDRVDRMVKNPQDCTGGLILLTELVYKATGKRSYILIDEYDKLLTDNYDTGFYDEIREFETLFLSAGLKGNNYLEKAMMTGVMRVSRESILSGLNNLFTYDVFSDDLYTDDFGFTEGEMAELATLTDFDRQTARDWYNGVKINGKAIYNTYSVMSYLKTGRLENYWGRSGTVDIILGHLTVERQEVVERLLSGETAEAYIDRRISLHELAGDADDGAFYSLLAQSGYLSVECMDSDDFGSVRIPNRELMNVWRKFILKAFVKNEGKLRTLFDNIGDPPAFDRDVEWFLNDSLSYHDIAMGGSEPERVYHAFVLGILSAYQGSTCKRPLSNRESGGGRYDVLYERPDYQVIFEFKPVADPDKLEAAAKEALAQIDTKRYFAEAPTGKMLVKTGVAFSGKQCRVKSSLHGG